MRGARRAILEHMQKYGCITNRGAFEKYGVTRLSAIIFDFRQLGYDIDTIMIESKTRFGEPCQYAKYIYNGKKDDK